VSLILRAGTLVTVRGDTALRAGDEVLVLVAEDHDTESIRRAFA
jgi:NhaP-type Na+/H+ and K+/H+ antiporter